MTATAISCAHDERELKPGARVMAVTCCAKPRWQQKADKARRMRRQASTQMSKSRSTQNAERRIRR